MSDPVTSLPQPPREPFVPEADPFPTTPDEAFVAPEDGPDMEETQDMPEDAETQQEAPEAPLEQRVRIGVTYSRNMDERVRVIQDRMAALMREFNKAGIDDNIAAGGVRGQYVEAYNYALRAIDHLDLVRERTASVRETFETL